MTSLDKVEIGKLKDELPLRTKAFINGEFTEKEAFEKLAKNVTVVDIPDKQRDAIIARILKETHPWEIKDNDGKQTPSTPN